MNVLYIFLIPATTLYIRSAQHGRVNHSYLNSACDNCSYRDLSAVQLKLDSVKNGTDEITVRTKNTA
ncbi:MAG: hypothetical protein IPK46_03855 [Saprospiraceae bacterium]|nr:hypothetical protein [Saprospiraceae bacterium]